MLKGRAVGSRRVFSRKVIGLSSLLHPPSRERHTPDRQTHERVRHVHARRGRGGVHSMGRCWRTRLRAAHQRPPAPLTRPSAGHWTEPALRVALAPRQLSPKPAASTHGRAGAWSTRGAPLGGRGAQKVEPKPWAHAAETERFERIRKKGPRPGRHRPPHLPAYVGDVLYLQAISSGTWLQSSRYGPWCHETTPGRLPMSLSLMAPSDFWICSIAPAGM